MGKEGRKSRTDGSGCRLAQLVCQAVIAPAAPPVANTNKASSLDQVWHDRRKLQSRRQDATFIYEHFPYGEKEAAPSFADIPTLQ
jgi:hypothetical protein